MDIIPVILSGGSGTRLWPLSRNAYPKQFLNLVNSHSLFQETVLRAQAVSPAKPIIVCNEQHRFMVAEQLRAIEAGHEGILLEPIGRNTAPAVALAALLAVRNHPENSPLLLVLPSDHLIKDQKEFSRVVNSGADAAQAGAIVTFGVMPDKPETGYGYIQADSVGQGTLKSGTVRDVKTFVEKPDLETAQRYIEDGDYLWNSGMFLFRADRYLQELEKYQPAMLKACETAMKCGHEDLDFIRPDKAAFTDCPADSIDYAVMEQTEVAKVVSLDAGWNDVGAWSSLWEVGEQDEQGNVTKGHVVQEGCCNSLIFSEYRLVSVLGLEDVVVVETPDAVLVAHKDKVQDVKKIVTRLNGSAQSLAMHHRKVYRPWGSYDSVDEGDRFQVKRITVNPGETLSLQKHFHRAEHWVVVSGTAEVTRGDEVTIVTENQSTYIPLGTVHRLSNPGRMPLELIEVQSGSYLGEDDIVRLSDTYGRNSDD